MTLPPTSTHTRALSAAVHHFVTLTKFVRSVASIFKLSLPVSQLTLTSMQKLSKRPHVASAAAAILWLTWERRQSLEQQDIAISLPQSSHALSVSASSLLSSSLFPISKTLCEARIYNTRTAENIATPSRFRKTLAALHIKALPVPRRLVKNDPVFSDSSLKRGIKQRARDETSLRKLQEEVVKAIQEKKDTEYVRGLHDQFCEIAYGKGVTPQMREDFVIVSSKTYIWDDVFIKCLTLSTPSQRYGCTGWTDKVLNALIELANSRGFVEIGAGNGQWARALTERYNDWGIPSTSNKAFEFVLAYDDMSELPLSPEIYHQHTQPAHDYFYSRVRKSDSVESVLRQWSCRGRVLLLVYPSPGPMAVESVKAYAELGSENDTVVYVGEGRGGANASEDLFDYFESGDWAIMQVLPVKPQPGGKGYEKLYILQKIKVRLA